jgi:SsrA-binding protein
MTAQEPKKQQRIAVQNRKARHEYSVLDTIEAGIALTGTEIKSIRLGNANLTDAYASIRNGSAMMSGMYIGPYDQGSYANVDPRRERRLLLHKKELRRLASKLGEPGLTLIPLQVHFSGRRAKILLGLCRGKREYDKREDIARREAERDIRRHHAR